jgi:hypothetical protein
VVRELRAAAEDDPARRVVESGVFKTVKAPTAPGEILAWDWGSAETDVL